MQTPSKYFRVTFGVIALCWVFTSVSVAQHRGTIAGTVFDRETARPIPLVNIYVRGSHLGTSTDSLGYFEFELPAGVNHVVAFSHLAYVKEWYDVEVEEGDRMDVEVQLKPHLLPMNDFIVWGTPKSEEIIASVVIREDEIERMGPLDFHDLILRRLPQLRWTSALAAAQQRPDFVLYVDGLPWEARLLDQIDPYTIRKVIIYRSIWAPPFYRAGSSRYVVDVRTR